MQLCNCLMLQFSFTESKSLQEVTHCDLTHAMPQDFQVLCSPESKPLYTLEELLNWSQSKVCSASNAKSYRLNGLRSHKRSDNHFKSLLCHDMKGGYLDDRYTSIIMKIEYRNEHH